MEGDQERPGLGTMEKGAEYAGESREAADSAVFLTGSEVCENRPKTALKFGDYAGHSLGVPDRIFQASRAVGPPKRDWVKLSDTANRRSGRLRERGAGRGAGAAVGAELRGARGAGRGGQHQPRPAG
jgi:hypothetical protein